jgi:2,3-bisphosphoglycerate-independent phosphoglycerate mutase
VARYLPGAAGTASAETTAASAETTTAQSGGEAAGRRDGGAAVLRDLMARAHDVLAGVRPSTDIWFWGEGTAPSMPSFKDLYGLRGAVIAAVDLVRGIGRYVGLDVLDVPGATGGLDTDYGAKARAAIAALDDHDLVWVHVEAPDEAGHKGRADLKVEAIERVDREVLAPVVACPAVPAVLVLPDHFTPVSIRTHAGGAVPFAFAPVARDARPAASYSERAAGATGLTLADGRSLLRLFLETTA